MSRTGFVGTAPRRAAYPITPDSVLRQAFAAPTPLCALTDVMNSSSRGTVASLSLSAPIPGMMWRSR